MSRPATLVKKVAAGPDFRGVTGLSPRRPRTVMSREPDRAALVRCGFMDWARLPEPPPRGSWAAGGATCRSQGMGAKLIAHRRDYYRGDEAPVFASATGRTLYPQNVARHLLKPPNRSDSGG
jgi:hypothetical protein